MGRRRKGNSKKSRTDSFSKISGRRDASYDCKNLKKPKYPPFPYQAQMDSATR